MPAPGSSPGCVRTTAKTPLQIADCKWMVKNESHNEELGVSRPKRRSCLGRPILDREAGNVPEVPIPGNEHGPEVQGRRGDPEVIVAEDEPLLLQCAPDCGVMDGDLSLTGSAVKAPRTAAALASKAVRRFPSGRPSNHSGFRL
jgi:hypothetical protein